MLTEPSTRAERPEHSSYEHRRFSLRDVPWQWSDVVVGIAPLVVVRLAAALVTPARVSFAPSWAWIPATLLMVAWMAFYP